jgi:N,N-dimethylformamidase
LRFAAAAARDTASDLMRRPVDHSALRAAGYFAELGVEAGADARFHLSSLDPAPRIQAVRLDRGAPCEPVEWPIARTGAPPAVQDLDLGSWLEISPPDRFLSASWSLEFEFRLTGAAADRVLIASGAATVRFATDGFLILEGKESATGQKLPIGQWLHARLCSSRDRVSLVVGRQGTELTALAVAPTGAETTAIRLGAGFDDAVPTVNMGVGRITLRDAAERILAAWRFPPVGRPELLAPGEGEGVLAIRNAPTFGLRSPRWDGSVLDPRLQPEHYDAIALHDDDLAEAGWPETHRIAVPGSAEPGVYALEVATTTETTRWPFFVSAKQRRADLVFLVPTFTYLAYADERLPPERFPWLCDDAGHCFAKANQLTSLYDTHNDGSGVSLAGFRRPLVTLREDYRYPLCGAPHLLPVDLQLLRFLHAQEIHVDILTDGDLDRGGLARLEGYRGLVTGSHPEYWTAALREALDGFRDAGRHIAYLGGNGGYWVTACDGDTIEVRRGLGGIRTWSSEPGETHLAMTGEPGGLWRHRGRAEHVLLGVGLQAMGFSRARPFRRTPDSYAPDLAWLFEGVGDEPIGAEGLVLGGAAGYEIDARSPRWKTPAQTRLLAVADGFDAGYAIDGDATEDGLPVPARGEMTLTQCASGGMIFAASSVSWCGALPQTGAMNAVGRITGNLLRRFEADRCCAASTA